MNLIIGIVANVSRAFDSKIEETNREMELIRGIVTKL